ncbi:uncharacterized protein LOC117640373 [Thrips palmi]|uniref:Uncharacterized protein LOC117640373 n=1 Tax=Thrips palmi TaxID=161013 RepID=A0A6P8YFP6_THRPL|nr:uncharacterized protein LOC117640373 [Thrips palmi]
MVARRGGARRGARGRGRLLSQRWWELVVGTSLLGLCCALCPVTFHCAQAAPWNQDEDLAALGSLDSLLAYEDLQQAVQQAEDAAGVAEAAESRGKVAVAPWQPADPDPQLYLLTEYDRGGQGQARVKRNRDAQATRLGSGKAHGLRRHVRNPPGGSSGGQRLSIVNPLDVLRQRLLLEIARRRKASVPQANREMLEGIGKRSWSPVLPPLPLTIEQQLERCLSQLGDPLKTQDKLTRLAILYKAIEYGKCDLTSDLTEQPDQRQQQQQQQQLSSAEVRPQEQGETNHLRDEQEEWNGRQQASGWSRNARAATSSNLVS